MAYNKTIYVNDSAPAISAENLNKQENELELLDNSYNNLVENNKITTPVNPTWSQNRIMISDGVLTEVESSAFCNSGFFNVGKNAQIKVANGFKIYAWDSAYNSLNHAALAITGAWSDGTVNYTFRSLYPYLIICVMKNGSSAITPSEAAGAISIFATDNSPFALETEMTEVHDIRLGLDGTEYASAGDAVRGQIEMVEDAYNDLIVNDQASIPYVAEWEQNRVMINNNVLVEISSSAFCNSGFMGIGKNAQIKIATGFQIYAWDSAYNELGHSALAITGAWTSNSFDYTFRPLYPYIIICVMKNGTSAITPSEAAEAISIHTTGESPFALKADIENLNDYSMLPIAEKGQIVYSGDTSANSGYIANAVSYKDGVIIACRSNGEVVRIGYDGTEETLLSLTGSNMEWRLCWIDSNENVYVSPHASLGSMQMADRGLYKLIKGGSSFTKVISLYDTTSSITTETQSNDDTIWTMCEDSKGYLYAGVYAHTVRANPAIYRSTDGGNTWTYYINFNTAGYTNNGLHIHSIIYSKWKKALYCIVGEINTIFKSTDQATTWDNLHVELTVKGSAMLPTEAGIFIGSDGSRNCDIDILFNDDVTHKKVFRGFANTVFAIRRSDTTGFLYAFTKVDSSVNSKNEQGYCTIFPPNSVFEAQDLWTAINEWKTHITEAQYNSWYNYYQSVVDEYPIDAIRPRHCAILVSRDGGRNWSILKMFELGVNSETDDTYIDGFWATGYFLNGECLTGRTSNNFITNPIVISEEKHKYVSGGCNLDGEIYVRTNDNTTVEIL